jgi:PucR family transcriptional regulator, purine catabolism regulatory protein
MRCRDALSLPGLAAARLVGGGDALDRDVRWVHVIDNPDAATWARPGQLVLTTGYAWPREDDVLRRLFRDLAAAGVAAVGLAVPQFFERFPAVVVEDAAELGLVLLEVPWEVPFAQITEEVHTAILGEQARVIERSEAIHRALTLAATRGASLDALVRTLAAETGHEVAIVADDGDVLAATLPSDERDRLAVLTSYGRREAGVTSGPCVIDLDDVIDAFVWGLPAQVVVQATSVATVWLLGRAGQPGPVERRAVEHAALVSALRLAHQRELGTVESRLRRSFVDDLLDGRVDGDGLAAERAHAAGFSSRVRYRVAIAELDLALPLTRDGFAWREAALERVRAALLRGGGSDLLTTSSNRVFVLVPDGVDVSDLWRALDDPRARLALSRGYLGMDGVQQAFDEARASVRHVEAGTWATFDDLVLPRAVRGDREAQTAVVERFVGPLGSGRSGERRIETLFALARQDFVLNATATALGVHISTLRHRLERIQDLLDLDLHDPDVRLRLRIAAYLREIDPQNPI